MVFEIKKVKDGSHGRKEHAAKGGKLFRRPRAEIGFPRRSQENGNHSKDRCRTSHDHASEKVHKETHGKVSAPNLLMKSSRQGGNDADLDARETHDIIVDGIGKPKWRIHRLGTILGDKLGSLEALRTRRTLVLNKTRQMFLLELAASIERLGVVASSDKRSVNNDQGKGRMTARETKA